jgi:hypothetical protein
MGLQPKLTRPLQVAPRITETHRGGWRPDQVRARLDGCSEDCPAAPAVEHRHDQRTLSLDGVVPRGRFDTRVTRTLRQSCPTGAATRTRRRHGARGKDNEPAFMP